jgi:O-antigen ligase
MRLGNGLVLDERSQRYFVPLVSIAIFVIPAFVLVARKVATTAFDVLVALGLVVIFYSLHHKSSYVLASLKKASFPLIAMGLLPLVYALNPLVSTHAILPVPYVFVRLALCALVVACLLLVPSRILLGSIRGFVAGTLLAALVAFIVIAPQRSGEIVTVVPTTFSNKLILLLMAIVLAFEVFRERVRTRWGTALGMIWSYTVAITLCCLIALAAISLGDTTEINRAFSIPFSNLSVLLTFVSALAIYGLHSSSLRQLTPNFEWIRWPLTCSIVIIGLLPSYWTQTRGSWLALTLTVLTLIAINRFTNRLKQLGFIAAFLLCLFGAYTFSPKIQERVNLAYEEIHAFKHGGTKDTSIGFRLQLLQASIHEITQHPLLGIGIMNYHKELSELSASGILTENASKIPHTHNELAHFGMILGIPGFLAVLALYLVPAYWFFKYVRHADSIIRTSALVGLSSSLLFFIFGWTDMMVIFTISSTLYTFVTALAIALILKRELELEVGVST